VCKRLMGGIFRGGVQPLMTLGVSGSGGSGVHHGCGFQASEKGEQQVMHGLGSLQGFRSFNYF
jgi:hypothetical protein